MTKPRRGKIVYLGLALLLCMVCAACAPEAESLSGEEHWLQMVDAQRAVRAKVVSIHQDEWIEEEGNEVHTVLFTAEINQGPLKGQQIEGRLMEYAFLGYRVAPLRVGSRVYLQPMLEETGPIGEFADYDRAWGLTALAVLFAVMLCLVGGMKGFRALVALIVTALGVAFIFIPMVRGGGSPVGAALLVCTLVSIVSLLILGGMSVKTVSSLLGILTGLVTAGLLTVIMQAGMRLTGLVDGEAIRLTQMPGMEQLNMNGLMFAAILIGVMGAAMDMAYSLASALEELSRKGVSGLELARSGMNVGRDIMGTMSNTLVLAYAGGSLHLIMLLAMDLSQFGYILSWELVATEILRALAGSVGLILIVPATSILSALLYRRAMAAENPFS